LKLEKMASLKKGSHEKELIYRSADRHDFAGSGQRAGRRSGEEARRQRAEHLHVAQALRAMDANEVKRLRELEQENARLKKLLVE